MTEKVEKNLAYIRYDQLQLAIVYSTNQAGSIELFIHMITYFITR